MNKSREFGALRYIVVFLLLFPFTSQAQRYSNDARVFYAGVVAGSNFSQIDGDNFAGYYKVGLNVGGIGYIQLQEHMAISWEMLYSQKGGKSNLSRKSLDTNIIITDYNVRLNYAEIPVMFNYFDKRKSHFGMGLSYGRLVGSSEKVVTEPANNIDLNNLYPYKKNAMDFLTAVQLHLWEGLFLNIRFQYSIIPVRDMSPPNFARSNKQYNNMWTVRLMYLFI
jgi:hypothetical protein